MGLDLSLTIKNVVLDFLNHGPSDESNPNGPNISMCNLNSGRLLFTFDLHRRDGQPVQPVYMQHISIS